MRSLDELGMVLRAMYEGAPEGEKVANIHLFGIKYAADIQAAGYTAAEVIRASGLRTSYQAEVSKGMNLAKYVAPLPRLDTEVD